MLKYQTLLVVGQRTDQIRMTVSGDYEPLMTVHKAFKEGVSPVFHLYKGDMNNQITVRFKEFEILVIARSSNTSYSLYVKFVKEKNADWSYFLGTPISFNSEGWVDQGSVLSQGKVVLCSDVLDEILESRTKQQGD